MTFSIDTDRSINDNIYGDPETVMITNLEILEKFFDQAEEELLKNPEKKFTSRTELDMCVTKMILRHHKNGGLMYVPYYDDLYSMLNKRLVPLNIKLLERAGEKYLNGGVK